MPEDDPIFAVANALLERAADVAGHGHYARAERFAAAAVARLSEALGDADPNLAPALAAHARLLASLGRREQAAHDYARAIALLHPLRDADAVDLELELRRELAHLLIELARYDDARRLIVGSLRRCRRRLGADHPSTAFLLNAAGMLCKYSGRYAAGRRYYLRALAIIEPRATTPELVAELANLHHNLGGLAHARGRYAEALPHARRAVELRSTQHSADSLEVAIERAALAPILDALDPESPESLTIYRDVIATFERLDEPYELAVAHHNLAGRLAPNDEAAAIAAYRKAIALKRRVLGRAHPDVAMSLHNLASLLGRGARVIAIAREAHAIFANALGPGHPHTQASYALVTRLRRL